MTFLLLMSRIERTAWTLPISIIPWVSMSASSFCSSFLSETAFASCAPSALRFCAVDSSAQTNRAIAVSVPPLPVLSVLAFSALILSALALSALVPSVPVPPAPALSAPAPVLSVPALSIPTPSLRP